jgi:PAS domain S-box-containing protein
MKADKIELDDELYFLFEIINIQSDADFKSQFFEEYNNMQSMLNATTDTALLIDKNGIILETNEIFAQNNGKRPDEILGTNVYDLFDEKLAKSRKQKVDEMFATGKPIKFSDVREGFHFNISLYPVKNEKGQIHRAAVFANDKTNEYKVLNELKRSEERFRKFAEMLPQTVFETNKENILTFANLNGLSTFEYTEEDIQNGVYIYDLVHPIEKKSVKALIKRASLNFSSFNLKLNAITKNGKVIPVRVHGNAIVKNGEYDGMRGIVVDYSQQTEIERELLNSQAQLHKSNQTKDKLFSILAHDLRGPFSGFINLSETLSTRLEEIKFQDLKDISGSLHISAINLYSLLDNLLSWARSQAGAIKVNPEKINVSDIVIEVLNYYKLNTEQKNIELSINFEDDVITYADKNMIRTVVRNLFSNAVKFVDVGGTIEVTSFNSNQNAVIKISDNGIGIPNDQIETMFELKPLQYTSGTMNEAGTGLGMNITNEFVEANNGVLRVESIEGEGTVFTIILPAYKK